MKTKSEIGIVKDMIEIYCTGMNHRKPCMDCDALFSYAEKRSLSCPHEEGKVFCSVCRIHCYDDIHREKIRDVMRYSSRRYFLKHPATTISHGMAVLKKKREEKAKRSPGA
ncbi:nitrous oxide-stimulated promoter family protein [Proteiniclasticum sp. C24MP]|uniref:nitrous oxide-stimulated promoter family protein n=1 Tax=Proteiniclasticum sp. C24MP TaxID=3374101 RepID=UPI0037543954